MTFLFSYCLDICVILACLTAGFKHLPQGKWRLIILFISLMCLIIPLNNLMLLEYIRTFTDHFSIASGLIALVSVSSFLLPNRPFTLERKQSIAFYSSVAIAGCIVYASSLGAFTVDIYQWGYHDLWLISTLFVCGIIASCLHLWFICLWLLISLFSFQLNALPSQNLWDDLLDPWIVVYSLVQLIYFSYTALSHRGRPL